MGIKSTQHNKKNGKMKLFSWLAYQFDYAALLRQALEVLFGIIRSP